jgi:hypothetical protein
VPLAVVGPSKPTAAFGFSCDCGIALAADLGDRAVASDRIDVLP